MKSKFALILLVALAVSVISISEVMANGHSPGKLSSIVSINNNSAILNLSTDILFNNATTGFTLKVADTTAELESEGPTTIIEVTKYGQNAQILNATGVGNSTSAASIAYDATASGGSLTDSNLLEYSNFKATRANGTIFWVVHPVPVITDNTPSIDQEVPTGAINFLDNIFQDDDDTSTGIVHNGTASIETTIGNHAVSYDYTNVNGTAITQVRTYNIFDDTAPVIDSHDETNINTINATHTELTLSNQFVPSCSASDNDPAYSDNCTDEGAIDTSVFDLQFLNYTATDASGNETIIPLNSTVIDTIAPTFDVKGNNANFTTNVVFGGGYSSGIEHITNVSDVQLTTKSFVELDTVDVNIPGDYLVEYTVAENGGFNNSTSIFETVTVGDDLIAPVFTLIPSNQIIEATSDPTTSRTFAGIGGPATATDNSGITPVISQNVTNPYSYPLGDTVIQWNATDGSSNIATIYQTITIEDTTAPTFTVFGYSTDFNTNLVVNAPYSVGTIGNIVEIFSHDQSITGDDLVDTSAPNTFDVLYRVFDTNGNSKTITETVNVTLGGIPVITLDGLTDINLTVDEDFVEPGFSASDTEDGDITNLVLSNITEFDNSFANVFVLTYNVTDSSDNTVEAYRNLIVTSYDVIDDIIGPTETDYTLDSNSGGDTIPLDPSTQDLAIINTVIPDGNIEFSTPTPIIGLNGLLIDSFTDGTQLHMHASTAITGNGWDGLFRMPTVTNLEIAGPGLSTALSVQFGDLSGTLSFNPAVQLTIPDAEGSRIFITEYDGTQNEVTVICDDVDHPTNIPAGFACYFETQLGGIVINTYTASTFSVVNNVGGSGSSCSDCTPPTFGKNSVGELIVSQGFEYNGVSTDVLDFHTEYPLITVKTSETNTVTVKAYENYGPERIQVVQFGLGMPQIGAPLDDAQVLVEVWFQNALPLEIVEDDPNDLVDITNLSTQIVSCNNTSDLECLQVSLDYIYRDQPMYNVMAINAIDGYGNPQTNYLNDGILVIGDTLNEPLYQQVSVSKAGKIYPQKSGFVTLTLVDYKTNQWQDEYGYMWSTSQYGPFLIDTIPLPLKAPDLSLTFSEYYSDRFHDSFDQYQELQVDKAKQTGNNYYPFLDFK